MVFRTCGGYMDSILIVIAAFVAMMIGLFLSPLAFNFGKPAEGVTYAAIAIGIFICLALWAWQKGRRR